MRCFACLACTSLIAVTAAAQSPARTRFEITIPAAVREAPLTGRVFVAVSRTDEREPRLQIGRTGTPFFGRDVTALPPGRAATIDGSDLGYPVESLRQIPAGEYYVQAIVSVYSEFRRADGHTVWMHDDRWEGQRFEISPGNLYSTPRRVRLDPAAGYTIRLTADQVIPPVRVPPDNQWVKRFRIQSPLLTQFWGRPIYIGATVLLPRDYDRETISYPVDYLQGHFSLRAPLGFAPTPGNATYDRWTRDDFPRVLVVTFQHPTPYFDDSYAVNSVNVGPYGDAILQELIPEIERRFRVIKEPWARWLSGGSTGGWEALALQIFHPDFFGGTWAYCPDPVTFTNVEGVDFYHDTNAFYKDHGWYRVPTPNTRETDGAIRLMSDQRNRFELARGTHGRSGEQIDVWSATWGPLGADGYFQPAFDKRTGAIHADVVQYWEEHFDLLHYLQRHWTTLGPKLVGKLHVYQGDMDNFYLNVAVRQLQAWMETTEDPHDPGYFVYGDGYGHCFAGPGGGLARLRDMAEYGLRHKPEGTTTPWWKY